MGIISPMATGSGAHVVHSLLEKHIPEYLLIGFNPYLSLFPLSLPWTVPVKGADLIHTAPDYASFFFRKSIPLVITFHNYVLDGWMKPFSSWAQRLYYALILMPSTRMGVKRAGTITAVSHFTARMVQKDLNVTKPLRVIHNGVDIDAFTPAPTAQARKEIRVFVCGNLTRRKGVHWLPSIAQRLSKQVLIYYTQGLQPRSNLPVVAGLKSIGPVRHDDIARCYRDMDILLVPTVREGFGLAIAEAMACGLPVVASNCSAIPELIDDGEGGFLCPVGDIDAFSEKINLLADSPKLRRKMGEYNRAKVEKMFTLDRMIKEYQDLFQEVLG